MNANTWEVGEKVWEKTEQFKRGVDVTMNEIHRNIKTKPETKQNDSKMMSFWKRNKMFETCALDVITLLLFIYIFFFALVVPFYSFYIYFDCPR